MNTVLIATDTLKVQLFVRFYICGQKSNQYYITCLTYWQDAAKLFLDGNYFY